jgi:hypothetical protein
MDPKNSGMGPGMGVETRSLDHACLKHRANLSIKVWLRTLLVRSERFHRSSVMSVFLVPVAI